MKKFLISLICFLWALNCSAQNSAKELNIVVTINPMYSLVKNVVGDLHNLHLLIKKNQSPHSYQIRPSDVSRLNKANLVVTVGDGFEVFLLNYLNKSGMKDKVLKLVDAENLSLLPINKQQFIFDMTEGRPHGDHHHCHGHDHIHTDDLDWHFWSNPENAKAVVKYLAKEFTRLDPASAALYRNNADKTIARLAALDTKLRNQLSGLKNRNFLVMHDGYQYIEHRYGLSNVGVIITDKNLTCSVKHLKEMREVAQEKKVLCVFTEPQTSLYLTERIAKFLDTKVASIDVEWGEFNQLVPAEDLYFFMMEKNASNIVKCLKS